MAGGEETRPQGHNVGEVVLTGAFQSGGTTEYVVEADQDSSYNYGIYKLMLVE